MKHEIGGAYVSIWIWVDLSERNDGSACVKDDAINDQQIRDLARQQMDESDVAAQIDNTARVVRSYLD